MRLIHTADIHLDASFAASGMPPGFGNRRRQSLRDVFSAILRRAKEWPADAVLIPGDLFDFDRVSRDTAAFLRDSFAQVRPIPIFIAPGNHDPFVPGSPYASEAWPANVYIFQRPAWDSFELQHPALTVHGFAFDGIDISSNPFGALTVPRDGRIQVALGHGSERGRQPPESKSYAPFDARDAAPPGLLYLALGHFHSVTPVTGGFETVMYYSGTPEGHGFDEPGERSYLEIEIDESLALSSSAAERRRAIKVTPVPSSRTIYATHVVDCGEFTNTQQVIDAIRDLAPDDGRDHVLRVRLSGICAASLREQWASVRDAVSEAAAHIDIIDETQPAEDFVELAHENTSLGIFIERLNREIADAPDSKRRRLLERAREVGLAAYRGSELPIRGLEGEAR